MSSPNHVQRVFTFGVGACLLIGVLLGPGSGPMSARSSGGIGFVDLERVVDDYKKTASVKNGMRQVMDAKLDEIRKEEEGLRSEEEELQFLNRESEEFTRKSMDIATRRYQLRLRAEVLEKQWNRNVVRAYRELMIDIRREIDLLGKERGFMAIHRIGGSRLNGAEADEKEVVFKLKLQQVLYHDQALDVTDEVLTRLNR